jgi:uncharacterized protein (DUF2141 family)
MEKMPKFKNHVNLLIMAIMVHIIISCATVVAPTGGPEDKLPPRVSGTSLTPNSINQSTNLDLTLQFDEWIAKTTSGVAISPPIAGRLRLKVSGDKLRIYSDLPLDSNTTYTLTVTNAIKDLRNNPLEKPFQILFSTGPILDSLKTDFSVLLHDSLISRKKFPVVAFYPVGKTRAGKSYLEKFRDSTLTAETDTMPNVIREVPQYIAQTDSLGNGTLQGMQAGLYLAAAFLDENNNQKMDVSSEIAGIASLAFELTEEKKLLRFSLADLDSSSFNLDGVSQRGNREIEFSFSRNIVMDSMFTQKNNCFLTTAKDTLFSSGFYTERSSKNTVLLFNNLRNDTLYTARCLYAADSLDRKLDTARGSAKFRFKKIPDNEITPTVISRTDPAKGISEILPGQPIMLYYNRSVSMDTLNFRLSVNEDSVKAVVKQMDAAHLEISSEPAWNVDSKVKLEEMIKDSVVDTLLNAKILMQLNTISRLKLASLKGSIPGGDSQTVIVFRETTSNKKGKASIRSLGREWTAKCNNSGAFEIKNLPEGTYKIMYFKDLNGNGRLNSGSVYPLGVGEPWVAPEEELILPSGDDNILKELITNLPELPVL